MGLPIPVGLVLGGAQLAMSWFGANQAQDRADAYYRQQQEYLRQAFAEIARDQARWDSFALPLQEKLLRIASGVMTLEERQAKTESIQQAASSVIQSGAAAINTQATASQTKVKQELGARGLSMTAPGVVGQVVADMETARTDAIAGLTTQALGEAGREYDQRRVSIYSGLLASAGQRPSAAQAYLAGAGLPPPPGQQSVDASLLGAWLGESGFGDKDVFSLFKGLFNPAVPIGGAPG